MAWPWQLALTTAVLLDHLRQRRSWAAECRQQLVYSQTSGWLLEEEGRAPAPIRLLPSSIVSPWLIILHGYLGTRYRTWTFLRDSLDSETHRRLRVVLLLFAETAREGQS